MASSRTLSACFGPLMGRRPNDYPSALRTLESVLRAPPLPGASRRRGGGAWPRRTISGAVQTRPDRPDPGADGLAHPRPEDGADRLLLCAVFCPMGAIGQLKGLG